MFNKLASLFSSNKNNPSSNNSNTQELPSTCMDEQQYVGQPNNNNSHISIQLLRAVDPNKKVVAVIVSFCAGSSYDHLFTQVEQKAEEGTQVLVYACSSDSVHLIKSGFEKQSQNQIVRKMVNFIKQVDPDCVVFNWECSSSYSGSNFPEGAKPLLNFTRMMIDRGHTCMFSDFSLKALISTWDENILGPNPFVKTAEHTGEFKLQFDSQVLQKCPSAQLQIIGEMAAQGHCNVTAMGGTIVYGVNPNKAKTDVYTLEVLTVVTSLKNSHSVSIGDRKGQAGHILLKYKSGGHLLTSMGHWIQLMKVDTTEKTLFDIAAREYGQERAQQMQCEYMKLATETQRKGYISRNAVEFVQSSAPCANMSKKARTKY